jgi:hypothetical protein
MLWFSFSDNSTEITYSVFRIDTTRAVENFIQNPEGNFQFYCQHFFYRR